LIALVQRVRQARVEVAGQTVGAIEQGLLVFLCAEPQDGDASAAAPPALGRALYERVLALAREAHPHVAAGEFGAEMQVHLVNDGPVTIPLRVSGHAGPSQVA